ncbi:MAG: hypothetical protein JXA82_04960 [Sedimentisphaerales bacterium]|nr:hypothetical protein [Sedimentisphaerales bacterium]
MFQADWTRFSFWPEHIVKAIICGVWIPYVFDWYSAFWRLAGFRTTSYRSNWISFYSPARFWRGYHQTIQKWFQEDVFKPLNGIRHPTRALVFIFFLSGLMHEYIIDIAIGRFTGYMLIFFLVQGLASALTWRWRCSGAGKFAAFVLTFVFLMISSVYFFAAVNEGVSFYANAIPVWFRLW